MYTPSLMFVCMTYDVWMVFARVGLTGRKGVPCPYGDGCGGRGGTTEISPADLDTLVRYGHDNAFALGHVGGGDAEASGVDVPILEQADVDKLIEWLRPADAKISVAVPDVGDAVDPSVRYIQITTKKCPTCGKALCLPTSACRSCQAISVQLLS
jgi:hypothetical protein